jgi:hypothetical protein
MVNTTDVIGAVLVGRVAALLRDAGRTHHRAFVTTDGDDPEWPRWYAEHLAGPLGELFARPMLVGVLATELAALDVEHRLAAERPDWPSYYAVRIVDRYAARGSWGTDDRHS